MQFGTAKHHAALKSLLEAEWGDIELYGPKNATLSILAPITLTNDTDEVIGGLAFTEFLSPVKNGPAIWLNALLVIPSARGQGYAKQLIQQAEVEATQAAIELLYVRTEYPELYKQLGWQMLSTTEGNTILQSRRLV